MTDSRAFGYSMQHALSHVPSREMRNAWRVVGDMEKRVVATSIREYLGAEGWSFRREVVAIVDDTSDQYDAAIAVIIAECGDDPRAALKALLVANDFLGAELERLRNATSVSAVSNV